jgi:hypothetical protein
MKSCGIIVVEESIRVGIKAIVVYCKLYIGPEFTPIFATAGGEGES